MKFCAPLLEHLGREPGKLLVSQVADLGDWGELIERASSPLIVHRRRSVVRKLSGAKAGIYLEEGGFETGLIELPQGRDFGRGVIYKTLERMAEGGRLYVWGENRVGIKPIEKDFASLEVELVAAGGGERLLCLTRGRALAMAPAEWGRPWERREMEVGKYKVWTQPGVFSWEHLDEGSAMLLEALPKLGLGRARHVLDACCGYGVLGMAAGEILRAERVSYADDDVLAVECCRAAVLGSVHHLDLMAERVADGGVPFDVVVCNPPFHQGVGEDRSFVGRFVSLLPSKVKLVLVANRFLAYERELAGKFGNVRVGAEDSRYRVWVCE